MTDEPNESVDNQACNLMHAAATWLARLGADDAAAAVITITPFTGIGIWAPGDEHVRTLPLIDDAAVDVCEAAAPVVQQGMERLPRSVRDLAFAAISRRAKLQMVVAPVAASMVLRLVRDDCIVVLATCELAVPV
jgi:hypothetical protein